MHLTSPEHKLKAICTPYQEPEGINIKMTGQFQLVVRREGKVIADTGFFSNLILNQGREQLGVASISTNTSVLEYAQVGSGTSVSTPTMTALESLVASRICQPSIPWITGPGPTYLKTVAMPYIFPQGGVVGTIGEIGVGWTATAGNLFSRAQIMVGGFPSTLTLTSIDQLTVTYLLTFTLDLARQTGAITLGGVSYPYSVDNTYINATNGNYNQVSPNMGFGGVGKPNQGYVVGYMYGAGTALSPTVLTDSDPPGAPSTTSFPNATPVTYTYSSGAYTMKVAITVPEGVGNLSGGIQAFRLYIGLMGMTVHVLFYFTTPIPKDATKVLTLVYQFSWAS